MSKKHIRITNVLIDFFHYCHITLETSAANQALVILLPLGAYYRPWGPQPS